MPLQGAMVGTMRYASDTEKVMSETSPAWHPFWWWCS